MVRKVHALLLAAGRGSRLKPLTDGWPKCLMPVNGRPLLEYWLCTLHKNGITDVLVNVHHHRYLVEKFLNRERYRDWVSGTYETELLGTAGTLLEHVEKFSSLTTLLVHADNWCRCDFSDFLEFHANDRPSHTVMTMMTFRTSSPESCGIVEIDSKGVVNEFHEKIDNPPGDLANGAVYLIEPEVLSWLRKQPTNSDFSTEVLPHFVGHIATWENTDIHCDIGTIQSLVDAQDHPQLDLCWPEQDDWQTKFEENAVYQLVKSMTQ